MPRLILLLQGPSSTPTRVHVQQLGRLVEPATRRWWKTVSTNFPSAQVQGQGGSLSCGLPGGLGAGDPEPTGAFPAQAQIDPQ